MSLKNELRELSAALGGSTEGNSVSDLIENIAKAMNPLAGLMIEPVTDATIDLLGLTCQDLQNGISVVNDRVTGHLNYVTEYTGFSGNTEEQEGNYLVLKASVPDTTGVTLTVNYSSEKTLDSDGIVICRVTKAKGNKITFKAIKSGNTTFSKVIDISKLSLAAKPRSF